ncbi:MAG: hypothetical protein K9L28_03755 [Synergistales bacterium]|nr:hypothetical protein [Synergistales bacterium]
MSPLEEEAIVSIETAVIPMAFRKTWATSLYAEQSRPHLFVRITTAGGVRGIGEISPSPSFMGESAFTAEQVIQHHFREALTGINAARIALAHQRMDRAIHGNYAAKTAVDLALHDAAGKMMGVSVSRLLRGPLRSRVPQAWVLGLQDESSALEEARAALAKGYGTLKIKVGHDPEREQGILRALRREYGKGLRLRADGNQGFTVPESLRFLEATEEFGLECLEQPVPRWNLEGMRFIREHSSVAIMADESCASLQEGLKVIREGAADILNIKVAKVGGLHRASQIAALAEAAGLTTVAGCNLESGYASLANIHFAASAPTMRHDNDQIAAPLYERDALAEPLEVGQGTVAVPTAPGLGGTVREDLLSWNGED